MSTTEPTPTPIRSLLVANRGEIARRIIRTTRSMGIRTVAVFVAADADAPFVREADHAVRLDRGYLDGPAVVAAAQRAGADAVHPGYGFLSENADFAERVEKSGFAFIGPTGDVIRLTFDKGDLDYQPGQYIFLCVPGLTRLQYHPFSISSAPHTDKVTLHIRVLGGWTRRLMEYVRNKSSVHVLLDGPVGEVNLDIMGATYEHFILVSG